MNEKSNPDPKEELDVRKAHIEMGLPFNWNCKCFDYYCNPCGYEVKNHYVTKEAPDRWRSKCSECKHVEYLEKEPDEMGSKVTLWIELANYYFPQHLSQLRKEGRIKWC